MTLNLTVRSDVIDINTDNPRKGDIFRVDTNVWLWYTYPNSMGGLTESRKNDITAYLNYLTQANSAGAALVYSGLILIELASVIENCEFKIFQEMNPEVKKKDYRHNFPEERANVVELVESAWCTIRNFAVPVDITVDDSTMDAASQRFREQSLDGYDLLHLEAIAKANPGQIKVITDDSDYCTVPDIQLFTLHRSVMVAARTQNKLITRS
jgi:hypothetical protein